MAKFQVGLLVVVALIATSAIGALILTAISYLSPFGASLGMNR
jgi:hypothetical protein